jgi:hypothetical protein
MPSLMKIGLGSTVTSSRDGGRVYTEPHWESKTEIPV